VTPLEATCITRGAGQLQSSLAARRTTISLPHGHPFGPWCEVDRRSTTHATASNVTSVTPPEKGETTPPHAQPTRTPAESGCVMARLVGSAKTRLPGPIKQLTSRVTLTRLPYCTVPLSLLMKDGTHPQRVTLQMAPLSPGRTGKHCTRHARPSALEDRSTHRARARCRCDRPLQNC
jgi:hypothetical protein